MSKETTEWKALFLNTSTEFLTMEKQGRPIWSGNCIQLKDRLSAWGGKGWLSRMRGTRTRRAGRDSQPRGQDCIPPPQPREDQCETGETGGSVVVPFQIGLRLGIISNHNRNTSSWLPPRPQGLRKYVIHKSDPLLAEQNLFINTRC